MIIIFDGCDKTGKSTLTKELASLCACDLYHASVSKEEKLYEKYIDLIQHKLVNPTIADRFFTAEIVYGPIIRGRSRLTWSEIQELSLLINKRSGFFVHCFASPETIKQRFVSDNENYTDIKNIPDILTSYASLAARLSDWLPVYQFDSTETEAAKTNTQIIVEKIKTAKDNYLASAGKSQ